LPEFSRRKPASKKFIFLIVIQRRKKNEKFSMKSKANLSELYRPEKKSSILFSKKIIGNFFKEFFSIFFFFDRKELL